MDNTTSEHKPEINAFCYLFLPSTRRQQGRKTKLKQDLYNVIPSRLVYAEALPMGWRGRGCQGGERNPQGPKSLSSIELLPLQAGLKATLLEIADKHRALPPENHSFPSSPGGATCLGILISLPSQRMSWLCH